MSLHFDIAVDTDTVGIRAKIKADISHAMPILAQQILMDCNYFCKQDQGMLIDSSIMMTDFEAGDLIWDTVYANRQYWL
ncbi:MAG: minor capsid protein, partial [Ruthenibacterium sp.]